jgi:hypothetical protein
VEFLEPPPVDHTGRGAGVHDAVSEDEFFIGPAGGHHVANYERCVRRESCHVIDGHVLKEGRTRADGDLCKFAWAVILHAVDVGDHDVVNAVTLPVERARPLSDEALAICSPAPTWLIELLRKSHL